MGKKFLQTHKSRKRFVLIAFIAIPAVVILALLIVALSDGKGIVPDENILSGGWWVITAKIVLFCISVVVGAVLALAVTTFTMYFLFANSSYSGSLRSLVGWYDTAITQLDTVILPAIQRGFSWPFRKSTRAVRRWINSGS